jgi:hypothetical protein
MRFRELLWGFFYLFSAVFITYIAIWKFNVYLDFAVYMVLIVAFEYFALIFGLIIAIVASVAMVKSFYYERTDLTEEESTRWYTKVIVLGSDLFYFYLIFQVLNILATWT